ncbi:MAG TPA: biotin/lipoyl-binding protein [Solirubrobacteraceae bacterium]|nr:biotin/lipoyl-binding protein [Solirubrobacteraceae bacterium]
MPARPRAPRLIYALAVLCAGAIAAAILVVGPASGNQAGQSRTATASRGVVQSTVSGSGNIQAASQLNLGFRTGGTVTHIYVTQGQHVTQGQLLATLDPQSAEVTLEQAKASVQSAEANLAKAEETDGESSPGQSSSGSGAQPAKASQTASRSSASSTGATGSATNSTLSTATREANLASARASVKSARLTVQSDEQAVENTKLLAPESGTIVSLPGQVGETVAGGGTTRATSASAASSSGESGSGSAAGGSSSSARSSGSGSSGSASSSSSFAVLSDLSSMRLVVPLSESEVGNVRAGQTATVTIEALGARKVAAHVSEVAILSTSNSGVVSYDVTFQLDQMEAGLRPGMSATAEVVVKQAEGVNVPTSAISGGRVTVVRSAKHVRQPVVTGLAGNSATIILSGLNAGEVVVLPSATSTAGAAGSRLGSGRGLGGGGLGGAGLGGGAGFPTGAFLRGGG